MKALLSPDEWIEERQQLLSSQTMASQIYPLLEQEELYEQMLERMEKFTDMYALERYEYLLKDTFADRCRKIYLTYLQQGMERASNCKAYWSVIQILKKLRKYPDGEAAAQNLADIWKQKYHRRSSMLDELRKAGF